jgi:hypothetical protein
LKLKQLLPSLLLLIFSSAVFAQSENPFASIGKKGKILTLTKGQYDETFDADSIQQIGSSLINVHTMKIVKLLTGDESKKRLKGEKHSRFLSTDPLAKSYPMLTPYQYASNRPIDGIDMDGLEYVTYIVTLDIYGKGNIIMNEGYVWYNANQHNAHGKMGQGVLYKFMLYNSRTKECKEGWSSFVSRNATTVAVPTEYGNYMGATSLYQISKTNVFSNFTDKYDYTLPPIDAVDQGAYFHDKGYDNLGAVGSTGLFKDFGTTPVDEAALNTWNEILGSKKVGDPDPFNGQSITSEEMGAAKRGASLFEKVVSAKKTAIADFMTKNFGNAVDDWHKVTRTEGLQAGLEAREESYQLFLSTYMTQDKKGNWQRKDGMWDKNNKPIAPAK